MYLEGSVLLLLRGQKNGWEQSHSKRNILAAHRKYTRIPISQSTAQCLPILPQATMQGIYLTMPGLGPDLLLAPVLLDIQSLLEEYMRLEFDCLLIPHPAA
jgi:hypothetical protein